MFDLFRSRAKAVRYLLGAILVVVSLSMVIALIPGFVGAGYSTGQQQEILAEVDGEQITATEVSQEIQQRLKSGMVDEQTLPNYVPLLINAMIGERALAYQSRKMGFEVSDKELAKTIESSVPQLYQNGQFVGRDYYEAIVNQAGMTVDQFETGYRENSLMLRLQNLALVSEIVTDAEVEDQFRRNNQRVQLEYIVLAPADLRSQVQVSQQEMLDYFDQNRNNFMTPEQRDIDLLIVDRSSIAGNTQVPDQELQRMYDAQRDQFRTPERIRVRHILFFTQGKTPEEAEAAHAKAEDVLQQLKDGADFATLAKEYSEDTVTGANGGVLPGVDGWITRGATVPNFENAAFALAPGQLSDVVQTPYGYHIIRVDEKDPGHQRTFDEVKDELRAQLQSQYVNTQIQNLADQVHSRLEQKPGDAVAIAKDLGVQYQRLSHFDTNSSVPALSSNGAALDMLNTLGEGDVSQVLSGNNDTSLAVASVVKVYEPQPAEFAQVEGQIRSTLTTRKATLLFQQKRATLNADMPVANLDVEARKLGVEVRTSDFLALNDPAGDLNSMVYFQEAYSAPIGAAIGPVDAMDRTVLARVAAKIDPDMSQLPAQRAKIVSDLKQQKALLRKQLLDDGVVTQLVQEGVITINQPAIDTVVAQYRKNS